MRNKENIDWLLETKAKNDKAIAEYACSLREKLRRLENAERQQTADSSLQQSIGNLFSAAVCRLLSAVLPRRLLFAVLLGVAMGYCVHVPHFITQEKPPIIKPAEETLDEFVSREAGRLLTADERTKLITVAEQILQQDFTRPSAIVEEFTFQRRLAGINSPAFNAFSDKWTEKVGEMQPVSVEAVRQLYQSLLQGLLSLGDGSQEASVKNQTTEETLQPSFPAQPIKPVQRQRIFR